MPRMRSFREINRVPANSSRISQLEFWIAPRAQWCTIAPRLHETYIQFLIHFSLIAIVSVHGGWSGWSLWRPCSVTCGSGVETLLRNCTNPAPQHGGEGCKGSTVRSNVCKKDHCPGNVPNCCWSNSVMINAPRKKRPRHNSANSIPCCFGLFEVLLNGKGFKSWP